MESRKPLKISLYILLSLIAIISLAYALYVRTWVADLYAGKASEGLTAWVQGIYPRFFTEKHRFPLEFFLQKTDQMLIRGGLSLMIVWVAWFYPSLPAPKNKERNFIPLTWLPFYFTVLAFVFTWDWYFELRNLHEAKVFYQPVFLLRILHLPFPSVQASLVLCLLMWASALGVWAGKQASSYFAVLFFVLFVLLQGFQMSFYKIDHTFALFTYWAALMPIILYHIKLSLKPPSKLEGGEKAPLQIGEGFGERLQKQENKDEVWSILLLKIAVALPYTLAGIEKVAISGFAWFQAETFQAYLHLHGQPLGLWVASHAWLCMVLSIGMMFFELGFILVVYVPWTRFIFLPAGILFHLGTYNLLGAGAWIHPWWLCYGVFWISTEKLYTK